MFNINVSIGLNILFFSIYVLIAIIIGLYSSNKESEEDFMIANRGVKGLLLLSSVTAGMFDGAILSIYIAYVYQYGFSAIYFFLGMSFGFLLFRFFVKKIKFKADELQAYSMPEYFFKILGKKNGVMFSIFLVIQFFGYLIINFILSGKVFVAIFNNIPYPVAVCIGGIIILSYLLLAGFKAVIRTDFYQLLIMIIMTCTVALFLVGETPFNKSDFQLSNMGIGNIIGFFVLSGFGILVAPDLWQRVFAAKDIKSINNGLTFGAIILPMLAVIITVVGLATKHHFPNINPEDALILGFSMLLPFIIKQFGTVMLYAVALSSSDTVTFVVSSIFTRDFKNYTKKYSDESMKKMTRIFMIIFVLAAIIVAILYQKILSIAFSLASLNLALFPVVFGTLFWQLKEKAVFWSLILSLLSVVIISITYSLTPETASISLPVALFSLIVLQFTIKNDKNNILITNE
jgi:Na+/proline symporter